MATKLEEDLSSVNELLDQLKTARRSLPHILSTYAFPSANADDNRDAVLSAHRALSELRNGIHDHLNIFANVKASFEESSTDVQIVRQKGLDALPSHRNNIKRVDHIPLTPIIHTSKEAETVCKQVLGDDASFHFEFNEARPFPTLRITLQNILQVTLLLHIPMEADDPLQVKGCAFHSINETATFHRKSTFEVFQAASVFYNNQISGQSSTTSNLEETLSTIKDLRSVFTSKCYLCSKILDSAKLPAFVRVLTNTNPLQFTALHQDCYRQSFALDVQIDN